MLIISNLLLNTRMDNIYKNIEEFNSNKNAILSATIPNKSFGHLLDLDISRKIWYF